MPNALEQRGGEGGGANLPSTRSLLAKSSASAGRAGSGVSPARSRSHPRHGARRAPGERGEPPSSPPPAPPVASSALARRTGGGGPTAASRPTETTRSASAARPASCAPACTSRVVPCGSVRPSVSPLPAAAGSKPQLRTKSPRRVSPPHPAPPRAQDSRLASACWWLPYRAQRGAFVRSKGDSFVARGPNARGGAGADMSQNCTAGRPCRSARWSPLTIAVPSTKPESASTTSSASGRARMAAARARPPPARRPSGRKESAATLPGSGERLSGGGGAAPPPAPSAPTSRGASAWATRSVIGSACSGGVAGRGRLV